MKWFFVILLTQTQGDLHEGFLWYDPSFKSEQECSEWVNQNPARIIRTLNYNYTDWEINESLCVREDKLQDIGIRPYVEDSI